MLIVLITMPTVPTKNCSIPPGAAPELLIYSLTFHEITPTFTSPEGDLSK